MPATTELRLDPVLDRLVVVAAGRAERPHTVADDGSAGDAGVAQCPFCPGHESMTTPEITRTGPGAPGTPGWRVRVFPNLYPIVGGETAGERTDGEHEVVVLSPDHWRAFGALDDDEVVEAVCVLRDRVRTHLEGGRPYAIALMNHRRAAGASIAHPHAQVIALDFVPPEVLAADRRARTCEGPLLDHDLEQARVHRTVVAEGDAVAWLPHAGWCPYFARVADPGAGSRFDEADDRTVGHVARSLRDLLARLTEHLHDPPYNVAFHSAAADGTGGRRWYAEITPRVSVPAGFEMSTGVYVNTTPPETAAARLRDELRRELRGDAE
jgi:UDPglucose--hexose-1-phosphate uridylyltransferase